MLSFKKSNKLIKRVIESNSPEYKAFQSVFKWTQVQPSWRKSFTDARVATLEDKRTATLILNPITKDFIINIVANDYVVEKLSNKKQLL
jgi:hypothetical protein